MKCQSLSARRAWIEILLNTQNRNLTKHVALRKESVDRNVYIQAGTGILNLSLSARRAWIEIYIIKITRITPTVALRKESVDRNSFFNQIIPHSLALSLSARRAWIEIETSASPLS